MTRRDGTARWHPAAALALAVLASAALATSAPGAAALVQDSVAVVKVKGLRVEVPRPTTTTGGTSAVEVSVDSAGIVAAPTMEDFLRRMPLIQIRANSRGEAQPALRGAEDRQIAVLLDGIPLTLGWDHRTDVSIIPLTAVRQMTLLRGLSSMLHGPNVLGGALEFDVARGAASRPAAPVPITGAVSFEPGGGTNASATAGALLERDYSSWVVRGGAAYRDRSGVQVPDEAFRDPSLRPEFLASRRDALRLNSDRRQLDGFVSASYVRTGGAWLSGLTSASSVSRGVPPEAHVSNPRLWRYPAPKPPVHDRLRRIGRAVDRMGRERRGGQRRHRPLRRRDRRVRLDGLPNPGERRDRRDDDPHGPSAGRPPVPGRDGSAERLHRGRRGARRELPVGRPLQLRATPVEPRGRGRGGGRPPPGARKERRGRRGALLQRQRRSAGELGRVAGRRRYAQVGEQAAAGHDVGLGTAGGSDPRGTRGERPIPRRHQPPDPLSVVARTLLRRSGPLRAEPRPPSRATHRRRGRGHLRRKGSARAGRRLPPPPVRRDRARPGRYPGRHSLPAGQPGRHPFDGGSKCSRRVPGDASPTGAT